MLEWLRIGAAFLCSNAWALGIALFLTVLLTYPLVSFMRHGWVRKAEEVSASLTDTAKQTYFRVFWNRPLQPADAMSEFATLYRNGHGRLRFLFATILAFVITAAESFHLGQSLMALIKANPLSTEAELGKDWRAVSASIAGAYTFVAWDFFARMQRRNLVVADVLRGALRLAMAIPIGMTFAILSPSVGVFLAFGVGVFPLQTIMTILRRQVNDKLKLETTEGATPDNISLIAGIDRSIAERIEDADITTIPQLAWCEPILLVMRTNLGFDYVVDIVGQALAWVYLGDKLAVLRPFGLRSAYEIRVFHNELTGDDQAEAAAALRVLNDAAATLKMQPDSLRYAFAQIAEDGATEFLYEASLAEEASSLA